MNVILNRSVSKDVRDILRYYEAVSGHELASEFFNELMVHIHKASENPERHHVYAKGLRRANLERFPYHFLYRTRKDAIYVLVVRHEKRDPMFGMRRREK